MPILEMSKIILVKSGRFHRLRTLYQDEGNDLQVQWNYQSLDNGMQSLSWAYKLDEDFYGTSTILRLRLAEMTAWMVRVG